MFKTNSRKGMSLAVISALAVSFFVGAPAQAAGEVTLSPDSGTTYAAISGEGYTLQAVAGSTIPSSSWSTLKFKIANASNATLSATASAVAGGADDAELGVTASSIVVGAASTTSNIAKVAIVTAATDSDIAITVQAWLDSDNDGVVDTNEYASAVQTVNFYKLANVTFTTTLTPVVLGAGKVVASVATDKGINLAQLDNTLAIGLATMSASVYYTVSGTVSTAGAFTAGTTVTQDDDAVTGKISVTHTIAAGTTYVAQAVYNGAEVGSEVYSIVGAATVTAIDSFTLSAGVNAQDDKIRTGATAVEFTAQVSKSAGVAAAEGTAVTVTIKEAAVNSLKSTGSITAGGKVLTNSSSTTVQSIEFTATVGAKGKVTVPVALAGLVDGNSFIVSIDSQLASTVTDTYTITDTAAATVVDLNLLGTSAVLKAAKGSTITLKFGAMDNFGQPLTGDYRMTLTNAGATATLSAAVVNGVASFSYTDLTDKTEGQFSADLEKFSSASNTYVDAGLSPVTITPEFGTVTAAAATTLVASSASYLVLNNNTLSAADTRVGEKAPTVVASGNIAALSGQVTDANGLATTGEVTLSAADTLFKVGGVYSVGSVTVRTDSSGNFAGVSVYRNIAGAVTVSATVGSATKDLGLSFVAAAETAATTWTVTAPENVVPGSTFQVKAKLTDKWGNPVKVATSGIVSVKYVGPGFVTATLPSTTDASGELSFNVLLGSADTGTATVTFAYDGDATASTTTDNVSKVATVTVGAAAAVVADDQKLTVGSFKGYVAIYTKNYTGSKLSAKVAGKWLVVNNLSSFTRTVRLTGAGYTINVDLYIDGVFVRTDVVVTK